MYACVCMHIYIKDVYILTYAKYTKSEVTNIMGGR